MVSRKDSNSQRKSRHIRVRFKISGTAERPRLCVYRSGSNIQAQIIDDVKGVTLVEASTYGKDFTADGGNKSAAREVGKLVAQRAIDAGINDVVFDRAGYLYHGRVKELAEGAREGGLKF
jgi:ribosomal protein L18, bacterial type